MPRSPTRNIALYGENASTGADYPLGSRVLADGHGATDDGPVDAGFYGGRLWTVVVADCVLCLVHEGRHCGPQAQHDHAGLVVVDASHVTKEADCNDRQPAGTTVSQWGVERGTDGA